MTADSGKPVACAAAAGQAGAMVAPRPAVLLALLLPLLALTAVACTDPADGSTDDSASATGAPAYGEIFLDGDECASRGRTGVREVRCNSERAAARVVARHHVPRDDGPLCPDETDYVLRISEHSTGPGASAAGDPRPGYACMRNLGPPHPGDPGGGGGPRTIVGDCVFDAGDGEVKETACDGSGSEKPGFEVTAAVAERDDCPDGTSLYIGLDGTDPVGCARRL